MCEKYILLVFVCLAAQFSGFAQALQEVAFPVLRHPAPGYYLIAQNSSDSIALIDHAGKNVFRVAASYPINLLCTDSTITYYDEAAHGFVRRNSRMVAIDTLRISGGYDVDFHEGHVLSNGNYIILGIETRIMDLSGIVPGGRSDASVLGAVFQERTFSGSTVFEWRSLDHIPVVDATEDIDLTQPMIDYIHVNSVIRDTDGNYLVSCRHTDEIIKVSRTTGNVMWRMGGQKSKGNQFTFIDDTVDGFFGFSHQHDVSRTPNGRIIMFDNGILKPDQPNPNSRVAEYAVDETLKTARLTWSYRPTPDVFALTMGSVQDLGNGNVLIGLGSGSGNVIGREISRDGTTQAEIQASVGMIAYRVRKAVFAMSGTERVVSSPGTVSFTHGDSTTHFNTTLSRVDAPTSIIVERHSYAPHNMSFGTVPCIPMAMRWVIRVSDITDIAGSMRFNIGSFGIRVPALMQLYRRDVEGMGAFTPVTNSYDAATTSLVVNNFKPGEYLIAYPMCYDPVPSLPTNNATNVSNNVMLRWTAAVQTGGYDVEVYKGSGTAGTPIRSFHTTRLDTTVLAPEAGTRYAWRVRALRPAPNPTGIWSGAFTFRTRLAAPVALAPSSLPDSVAVQQKATFRWTRVKGAAWYRIQIVSLSTGRLALDTIVIDTTFRIAGNLPCNETLSWAVRAEIDTSNGDWSNTLFIFTTTAQPRLLLPLPEEQGISPESVTCTWSAVDGSKLYHIRIYKDVDTGSVWFQDSVTSTETDVVGMSSLSTYYWQVRSIGRYGPGPWSNTQWFMTHGQSVLGVASLLAPVDASGIDTLQATLTWTSVIEATYYNVQLTTKASFMKPDVEWKSLHTTTVQCPPLEAGKMYRWRIMAMNDIASGPWSDTAMFSTLPGPDDALEPLTPISGSVDLPLRGTVSFITDTRFNEYRVEYALVPMFTTVDQIATVTGAVAPYNLLPKQQYWWRVVGLRNGVRLDTGSTANFTTGKDAPTTVVAPSESSAIVRLIGSTLTLEGSVQGADIQIMDIAGRSVYQHTQPQTTRSSEDLSHLPMGVYVALVRLADSRVVVYSFVITDKY